MFNVRRIDLPAYARNPDVWLHNMKLKDHDGIQSHREELLNVVHKEVEEYLNTPDLVYDSDDGFPSLTRLTGGLLYFGRILRNACEPDRFSHQYSDSLP